jgi:DNA-binding LytR/AlgR family response regulator
METFKIQIVEDELLVARDLAERLKQSGYEVVHISDNMDEAVAAFKKHAPDLVLLDITISGTKTGIDIAHAITEIQPTPFIYITAHADALTVNKAKNTFPAAYVIKPFTTNSLLVSIELALHNFAYQNNDVTGEDIAQDGNIYLKQNHVYIKDGYKFIKILLNDILYLNAEDNYVKIVTEDKSFLIRNTLTKTTEVLQKSFFVRIHRSWCINTNHIDSFTENEVIVKGTPISIGRNYKEELMNIFKFR